jgi:iron complex transport system ATP-binding protein
MILQANSIAVRHGPREVLQNVLLSFEGPGLTALIGPNGAGKSTLMDVLAGLRRPASGQVTLDGADVFAFDRRALARRRSYLPQSARVDWPMEVERVIALGLMPELPAFGGLPPSATVRIGKVIEACDLAHLRAQAVTNLSGGELSRVMLARALVAEPAFVLVDEPTAGLDPRHARDAMAALRRAADAGAHVIVSLHDLTLLGTGIDRVIILENGRVFADGPPADVMTPDLLSKVYRLTPEEIAMMATNRSP